MHSERGIVDGGLVALLFFALLTLLGSAYLHQFVNFHTIPPYTQSEAGEK